MLASYVLVPLGRRVLRGFLQLCLHKSGIANAGTVDIVKICFYEGLKSQAQDLTT